MFAGQDMNHRKKQPYSYIEFSPPPAVPPPSQGLTFSLTSVTGY